MSKLDNDIESVAASRSILTYFNFMRKNRVKVLRVFLFINLFLIPVFLLYIYYNYNTFYVYKVYNPTLNLNISNLDTKKFNYFLEVESRRNVGLIVDLPDCKILNISAWDSTILPLVNESVTPINCDPQKRIWTYVNGSDLVLNKSAIISSGFSFESLSCCFHSFERVEQSQNNYTKWADLTIRFSYFCTKIEETTTPMIDEYIRVICRRIGTDDILKEVVYKKYHIFALSQKSSKTREKIDYWKSPQNVLRKKPPNVILIGIDSVSRLSSIRNMPKTRKILKKIGAIEYFGYTKVGENTFPNAMVFLTGYSVSDIAKICFNSTKLQDYCPYIWRDFDKSKYYTAEIEDIPIISIFNMEKAGFVQQPTDFYYRPFSIAYFYYKDFVKTNPKNNVYKSKGYDFSRYDCIGYEKYETNFLNYIRDSIQVSEKVNVPIFVHSWQTSLAHDDLNGAQLGDQTFADFFDQQFDLNNNTVLIFLSDHGYRFGKLRNTFPGWLEDKLPTFFISLSQDLKEKYPEWEMNLKENSKKLTSPYDLYQTMSDILKITSNVTIPDSRLPNGQILPRKFGQSLISTKVQDSRTCSDAGIPDEYCACLIPKKINLDDPKLQLAAEKSLDQINSFLPQDLCSKLHLKSIYSGALLEKSAEQLNYIVSFLADPGEFKFEANVPYFLANASFSLNSTIIQRVNKINPNYVRCVNDSFYKLYCYCLEIFLEKGLQL